LTSLARTAPNGCGSRGSGPGPEYPRRRFSFCVRLRGGGLAVRLALAASRTAWASSGPVNSSSGTADLPLGHVVPYAAEPGRHVFRYRAGHQELGSAADQIGEPVPAARVEFGEHVVER